MKVITFGEIMLRLSPPGHARFVQASTLDATFGGGEANVAVSLANFSFESHFVTKLPQHEIGQAAVNDLRRCGVRTDYIARGGGRIGIYFLETGASQRPSKVIYDRAHSAISEMYPDEVDWTQVFHGASWFHWTGITPAISKHARGCVQRACEAASEAGVTISCDLNFRKKLWTEREAQSVMNPMMEYVDVCIANEEDAQKSLGLDAGETDVEAAHLDEASYFTLVRKLKERYGFQAVAVTLRESFSASRNGWSAVMLDDKQCADPYRSKRYDVTLVDRVGGGDAFAGGLIYGLLHKTDTQAALEFAVAASCLKQTIPGDFNMMSVEEVERLAGGTGSGRVDR